MFTKLHKLFDQAQHQDSFELPGQLYIFGKAITKIWTIYVERTVCIRKENELSVKTKIDMVVKEECIFKPDLINLYSNAFLRDLDLDVLPGFIVGGLNLNNIIYADDNVLMADTERKS